MEIFEYLARYTSIDSASYYYYNSGDVGVSTSSALLSWSPEPTDVEFCPRELQILINPLTDVFSIHSDEEPEADYLDILSLLSVSIERPRYVRDDFYDFINQRIIPDFRGQCQSRFKQFAVVLLLSEFDLLNIKRMSFCPDLLGKPILDKTVPVMPRDPASYRNYIVARTNNKCHSEKKLFGNCSELTDTPFNHLWRAYLEHHRSYPRCILIYSWNFPCSHCTDLILKSLGELTPYSSVSTIVAHTRFWSKDTHHEMSTKKLESMNISVEYVPENN